MAQWYMICDLDQTWSIVHYAFILTELSVYNTNMAHSN